MIGEIGSIGASDLCWGATMGLAFLGEGEMVDSNGTQLSASQVLDSVGMSPLKLGPKDGLVLANHSGFSASLAAFAVYDAFGLLNSVQAATAMSMQAFVANLSPIQESVVGLNGSTSQRKAAETVESVNQRQCART